MKVLIALLTTWVISFFLPGLLHASEPQTVQLKPRGYIQTGVGFTGNTDFQEKDDWVGDQRARLWLDMVAHENLKGTVGAEFNNEWGTENATLGSQATGQLELKHAYLQFTWPGTETRFTSGIQEMALPEVAMGGNPVLTGDTAGLDILTPVAEFAQLNVGWSRGLDQDSDNVNPGLDTFFAAMPMETNSYRLSPFAAYTAVGKHIDQGRLYETYGRGLNTPATDPDPDNGYPQLEERGYAYWLGTGMEVNALDPVRIRGSFIYGKLEADPGKLKRSGYYTDLALIYNMPRMSPEVFFMYASGEKEDSTGSDSMPMLYNDGTTSKAPSMVLGDNTLLGITGGGVELVQSKPAGLWCLGFTLADIEFYEDLFGTLTIAYYQGTNEEDADLQHMDNALTKEDSILEVGLQNKYKLYERLTAILEAGYVMPSFRDVQRLQSFEDEEDASRVALGLRYSF